MKKRSSLALLVLFSLLLSALSAGRSDAAENQRYQRTLENYQEPDVILINQDRVKVRLRELLDAPTPVLVDFIYGTCTTICPILSAGYSSLQNKLGSNLDQVRLVSISIDPEYDTPEVMTDYLEKYRAKPGWDFLTGSREDIDKVMHAFDAYVPNKMAHYPITFLKGPGQKEWVRIYGLIGTSDLMKEYEKLVRK